MITKDFLYINYVVFKKTSEQIGSEVGLSGRAIRYQLKKHGFQNEMCDRRRASGLGKSPTNKGITVTDTPKLGRYYVTHQGRVIPRCRMIMELHLGRKLDRSEIIHHKDHNPLNDDIENLQIMTQSEHIKLHNPVLVRWKNVKPT